MRADPDAVTLGQPHGVAHVVEIGSMETAGNVGHGDQGHQRGIVAEAINAKSLAHVAVDDGHAALAPVAVLRLAGEPVDGPLCRAAWRQPREYTSSRRLTAARRRGCHPCREPPTCRAVLDRSRARVSKTCRRYAVHRSARAGALALPP